MFASSQTPPLQPTPDHRLPLSLTAPPHSLRQVELIRRDYAANGGWGDVHLVRGPRPGHPRGPAAAQKVLSRDVQVSGAAAGVEGRLWEGGMGDGNDTGDAKQTSGL